MNYIGSKYRLSSFLLNTIKEQVGNDLSNKIFCDLFAGTGIVGRTFKPLVKKVISNDLEYYSFVVNSHYIGNCEALPNLPNLINYLNNLEGITGFVANNYSTLGAHGRMYYSESNAQKIDAIRSEIEVLMTTNKISKSEFFALITALIEAADSVANTASVYGAYLKKIKKSALKHLELKTPHFTQTDQQNEIFQTDSAQLIKEISGDILYLDPPYNQRQYGANYHVLTTLAKYDNFEPKGITGMRNYTKSDYCKKNEVTQAFQNLIENAQFEYIFLSYNNEGLMSPESIKNCMSQYGKYALTTTEYQRFKADKTENRNHKAASTIEYLHILHKY